jgi:hypothetical protein
MSTGMQILAKMNRSSMTEEEKRRRATENYQTRIQSSGNNVPSFVKEAGTVLGGAVMGTLDILDRSSQAVKQGIYYGAKGENVGEAAWKGLSGERYLSGTTMAKELGAKSKLGQFAGGLAIDVAADPLSYATLGLGSFAKGFLKNSGTKISRGTLENVGKSFAAEASAGAKAMVYKQHGVNTIEGLAKRTPGGTIDEAYELINEAAFGNHWIRAKALATPTTKAADTYSKAKYSFGLEKALEYQKAARKQAGPGLTFGGKTLISGDKMQDAGNILRDKTRNKYVAPIGSAIDKVTDTSGKLFNTSKVTGLNVEQQTLYKNMKNKASGVNALSDYKSNQMFNQIATLQHGLTIGGKNADTDLLQSIIATDAAGIPQSTLKAVITDTPAKKFAARELAKVQSKNNPGFIVDPDNMTLEELLNVYMRQLKSIGIEERRVGLLKPGNIDAFNKAAIGANGPGAFNYVPHVINSKIDAGNGMIKGGKSRNFSVGNAFARMKNPKYKGMTVAQINAQLRAEAKVRAANNGTPDIPDDFNFLETSMLQSLISRQLTSNRILADRKFIDNTLETFGNRVVKADDIAYYKDLGYDIVIPQYSLNILDAGKEAVEKLPLQAVGAPTSKVAQGIMENYNVLKSLHSDEALNFISMTNGKARMYAVPTGIVNDLNKSAKKQVNEGIQTLTNAMGTFFKVWKPLVTGMRVQYHLRNVVSSGFNNYLDIGTKMLDPKVNKVAAAVALIGRPKNVKNAATYEWAENMTHTLGGKQYKTRELYDAMVQNNALGTFFMTDASGMAKGIAEDIAYQQTKKGGIPDNPVAFVKSWAHLGKSVGNATEEYVRAVNFAAHLDMGETAASAAASATKHHFDYQDLTEFEKNVKNGLIPFYTWMRNNMPLQFEAFLNDPRIYQNIHRAGKEGAEAEGIDYKDLPYYLQQNMAIPFGSKDGRVRLIDAGLPLSDLSNGVKNVVTGANPFIKAAYELKSGKSLLTGAPLRSYDEETTVNFFNRFPKLKENPEFVDFFMKNPEIINTLSYMWSSAGVFKDVGGYALGSGAPDMAGNKTVIQGREVTDLTGPARVVSNMTDPNFTKYYSPEAKQRSDEYSYNRQLGNVVQMLEDSGVDVKTITELKKGQKKEWWK